MEQITPFWQAFAKAAAPFISQLPGALVGGLLSLLATRYYYLRQLGDVGPMVDRIGDTVVDKLADRGLIPSARQAEAKKLATEAALAEVRRTRLLRALNSTQSQRRGGPPPGPRIIAPPR